MAEQELFTDIQDWEDYGFGPEAALPYPGALPRRPLPPRDPTSLGSDLEANNQAVAKASGLQSGLAALRVANTGYKVGSQIAASSAASAGAAALAADTAAAAAYGSAASAAYAGYGAGATAAGSGAAAGAGAGVSAAFSWMPWVAAAIIARNLIVDHEIFGGGAANVIGDIFPSIEQVIDNPKLLIMPLANPWGVFDKEPSVGPGGQIDMGSTGDGFIRELGAQGDNDFDPSALRPFTTGLTTEMNNFLEAFDGKYVGPRVQLGAHQQQFFVNEPAKNTVAGGPSWQWFGQDLDAAQDTAGLRMLKHVQFEDPRYNEVLQNTKAPDLRQLKQELTRVKFLDKAGAAVTEADQSVDEYLNYGLEAERVF